MPAVICVNEFPFGALTDEASQQKWRFCCCDSDAPPMQALRCLAYCYEAVFKRWEGEDSHVTIQILHWEDRKLREECSVAQSLHHTVKETSNSSPFLACRTGSCTGSGSCIENGAVAIQHAAWAIHRYHCRPIDAQAPWLQSRRYTDNDNIICNCKASRLENSPGLAKGHDKAQQHAYGHLLEPRALSQQRQKYQACHGSMQDCTQRALPSGSVARSLEEPKSTQKLLNATSTEPASFACRLPDELSQPSCMHDTL